MTEEAVAVSDRVVQERCTRQSAQTVARKRRFLFYRIPTDPYIAGNVTRAINPAGLIGIDLQEITAIQGSLALYCMIERHDL